MASITFSGQLDQAMNEAAAEGNKILFIPQQTVGEVLPGAASELIVESDGSYSITLAYNTYSIYHYSDVTKKKTLIANSVVVSADTVVSTIPDLIGSTVPVTEDSVLTIQGYLTNAQDSASAAAESESYVAGVVDDGHNALTGRDDEGSHPASAISTDGGSNLQKETDFKRQRLATLGRKIENIAHRGYRYSFIENTMFAFTSALNVGADSLECDVSVSADGTFYVFHDTTVDSLTSGTGTFSELSDSYIDTLTYSAASGTAQENEPIPTFEQFLDFASSKGVYVYPEIKSITDESQIDEIVEMIELYNMGDHCMLQSFTLSDLQRVRTTNSNIEVGYLGSFSSESARTTAISECATMGNASLLCEQSTIKSTTIAEECASSGVGIGAWTVNNAYDVRDVMKKGVYRIMSDYYVGDVQ